MDDKRRKLIEVNVAWKVIKLCFQHNISSTTISDEIKRRVVEDIHRTMSSQNLGIAELHRVCDERLATLDLELQYPDGFMAEPTPAAPAPRREAVKPMEELPDLMTLPDGPDSLVNNAFDEPLPLFGDDDLDGMFDLEPEDDLPIRQNTQMETQPDPAPAAPAKDSYKPEAEKYSEKLNRTRKPLKELLLNECVQYGLVDRSRADYLVRQLPGKEPRDAEKEVVVELRNNLYEQVRVFLREYRGGPWNSPNLQEEIRLDIVSTPSVRSLLSLTLQLVKEQRTWLIANNKGLSSKLFGKNIKFTVE